MTVVNPKSISGINSITMASGSDNLLTIHANDTSEKVRVNSSGDVIVGSGVTLSPDGDIFATGVCTATSFVGSGANLTGIDTDLVSDTSPQLGGDLASNGHDIKIADASGYDGNNIYMGTGNDMRIHHDGSNFEMSNSTGTIYLRADSAIHIQKRDGSTKIAEFNADADCELYHNGTKMCETSTNGLAFPSGKGIDFSATSDLDGKTSELLDDYEEGTYTPILTGSSSNPTQSYAHQLGHYTKTGRVVQVSVDLQMAASGVSGGGGVVLLNLPFNQANLSGNQGVSASIGYAPSWGAITPTASYSSPNDTVLYLLGNDKDTGANFVQASQVTNGTRLIIGFSYITET